jgi:flagellar motor switch protein FliM
MLAPNAGSARMDQSQGNSVLRRKLGARAEAAATPLADDARLLARALARSASAIPGIVGSCGEPARRTVTLVELIELVEGEAFAALIAAPGSEPGLAVLDPVAAATLIEALTIGRLSRRPPPPRRATQVDAQLLSEVIDATLAAYDDLAGAHPEHRGGFRFQRFPADYRTLNLLLEASRYDLIVQPLALLGDEVRRDSHFLLALPLPSAAAETVAAPGRRTVRSGRGDDWARALESQVMSAPAQLTAVVGRVTMPLSDVMGLGIGSRLVLPLSNLEEIEVTALDGEILGCGRLGQFRAMRAVRLTRLGAGAAVAQGVEDHAFAAAAPAAAPDAIGRNPVSLPAALPTAPPAAPDA